MDSRLIPLTKGYAAIVDPEDYERLSAFNWCAKIKDGGKRIYAVRSLYRYGKKFFVQMHRVVMDIPDGDERLIDHENGDGLDNRKTNLRIATKSLNGHNHKMFSTNTSGYRGVSWKERNKKWQARITVNGEHLYLGLFKTKEDAAFQYDKFAVKYFSASAVLNFPLLRDKAVEWLRREK